MVGEVEGILQFLIDGVPYQRFVVAVPKAIRLLGQRGNGNSSTMVSCKGLTPDRGPVHHSEGGVAPRRGM